MSKLVLQPNTLQTPEPGAFEWDGKIPLFTPSGTQRGVMPGMQYYRLDSNLAGANATGTQSIFGVGCTLSSNTVYAFELRYCMIKSAGTTSHTVSNLFGGNATINNIGYWMSISQSSTTGTINGSPSTTATYTLYIQQSSATVITNSIAVAAQSVYPVIKGTVSVETGGTFIPQYSLSAAPGGAYTTQKGSYFLIYPIGQAGSNVNIGAWQ